MKISISDDCLMKLGNLVFDGKASTINGENWNITPSTATFNRVIAKGGIIENVVFKNSTVQAAGGQMIFKPSARGVFSNTNKIFTLDKNSNNVFSLGDYVLLSGENSTSTIAKIIAIIKNGNEQIAITLELEPNVTISGEATLTKLAGTEKQGENTYLTDSLLIGINPDERQKGGQEVAAIQKDEHTNLYKEGLTFIRPTLEGEKLSYSKPVLFLGNLDNLGLVNENIGGYGLYGENVFLQCSLTTKVPTEGNKNTYAGVNTTSNVISTQAGVSGQIVFWAGASKNDDIKIQEAPFFVTDEGNLFARSGRFEGAIISKSEIQGADIYAARIHGWEDNESGALSIYDTDKGILFKTILENNSEVTTLALGTRRFSYSDKNFVELSENSSLATFIGDYKTEIKNGQRIKVSGLKIESQTEIDNSIKINSSIDFSNEKISIKEKDTLLLQLTSNEISSSAKLFSIDKDVLFGKEDAHFLKYQSMNNGYNLYVG